MIRLSKKSEYALLALSYLRTRTQSPVSATDIAAHYRIPQALLAKVMQSLKRAGLVTSSKGAGGGYSLQVNLRNVTFLQFVGVFEETTDLVQCLSEPQPICHQLDCCAIRDPIASLNGLIQKQLSALTLEQLFGMDDTRIDALAPPPPL